jgi:hypothetical protein
MNPSEKNKIDPKKFGRKVQFLGQKKKLQD